MGEHDDKGQSGGTVKRGAGLPDGDGPSGSKRTKTDENTDTGITSRLTANEWEEDLVNQYLASTRPENRKAVSGTEKAPDKLSKRQLQRMEKNKERAKKLRESRLAGYRVADVQDGRVGSLDGVRNSGLQKSTWVDTNAGFLFPEDEDGNIREEPERVIRREPPVVISAQEWACEECERKFLTSKLFEDFGAKICDQCRDQYDDYQLVTKGTAQEEYVLADEDLASLKFIAKANPRNIKWTQMKLYLKAQVEDVAFNKWGDEMAIEEEKERRKALASNRRKNRYEKQIRDLRRQVRAGELIHLKANEQEHEHEYGPEMEDPEDPGTMVRTCKTCGHEERYEDM
eukprot:Clim_evm17s136 gene=Clim_evmTU17s136